MCSISIGKAVGCLGCLLLLLGMIAPLYTINLAVVELYPVMAAFDLRLALCFVLLLCGAAYATQCGRYVILASIGILTFLFTVLLHMVITEQVQALAVSFGELGGGASTLLGGILSGVADYLINAAVAPSWGWYLFIAAGIVLCTAGILGAVMERKHGEGEMAG
ncbi:MAG: hypothetical protein LBL85_01640 [Methanocalculaceae archaeon]|nr:hypothetical protein [Methanocalculaceae archaeon]